MRLKISKTNTSTNYYIIKDVNRNGKRTTNIVEKLGKIDDENFVPNTIPFNDFDHKAEINYNNQNIDLVEDFIFEIMNYKLSNRKATLEQEDMNKILEKYGISYTDEMNKFINALKNVNEKAIDTMTRTNQIGKVLCLHK